MELYFYHPTAQKVCYVAYVLFQAIVYIHTKFHSNLFSRYGVKSEQI